MNTQKLLLLVKVLFHKPQFGGGTKVKHYDYDRSMRLERKVHTVLGNVQTTAVRETWALERLQVSI